MTRASEYISGSLLAALCCLAPACDFEASETALPTNACERDDQCPESTSCRDGICVTEQHPPLAIALEITPVYGEAPATESSAESQPAGGGMPPGGGEPGPATDAVSMIVPPFLVRGPTVLDKPIEVPLLVEVSGNVRDQTVSVPSKISFIPVEQIEGAPIRSLSTTTTQTPANDSSERPSDFLVRVLQNVEYQVVVEPIAEAEQEPDGGPFLPPFFISNPPFVAEKSSNRLDVQYGSYAMEELEFALVGAPIGHYFRIHAARRGDPSRIVSSARTVVADRKGSNFSLLFAPGEHESYQLVVTPVAAPGGQEPDPVNNQQKTPVYPVFWVDDSDLEANDQAGGPADPQNSRKIIRIPTVPSPVLVQGQIELCARQSAESETPRPPSLPGPDSPLDLPVVFQATDLLSDDEQTPLAGSFRSATSAAYDDKTGKLSFSLELLPGTYEVVITPPTESGCGVFARKLPIGAAGADLSPDEALFSVPGMTYIKGILRTAESEPIPGATVQAQALNRDGIDAADESSVTRFNRTSQATTDGEGAFRLPVDLGSYDVIAKPPSESRFAWQILSDVDIGSRDREFFREIAIEVPVTLGGTLRYATKGTGVETTSGLNGATIRAFAVIDDVADDKRTVIIGRATADQEGNFTILLSPSLRSGWY